MRHDDDRVAVIGLGYVGLPLAVGFVSAGVRVIGVDSSTARVEQLRHGSSPIDDVASADVKRALAAGLSIASSTEANLHEANAIFVCVPTPIGEAQDPDLRAVLAAAGLIARSLQPNQLVILQSTTYPGTTNGPFRAQLEESGLIAGVDFGLAYAPERVNPGDPLSGRGPIPRLVGGITPADCSRAARLLRRLGGTVYELSSPDAAELAKLFENVFRNVNIALVNQLALLCERMGLDVWEVIDAAATKPFGFMPFRPGPGVGGHCIPVDPYYLAWRARQYGLTDRFVELAGDINISMPAHVLDLATAALNDRSKPVMGSRVGIIGVSFKPNVSDTRNSPSAIIMAKLAARGASVAYHDPHVDRFTDAAGVEYLGQSLDRILAGSDLVIVVVGHDAVDWTSVYDRGELVLDTVGSSRNQTVRARQVLTLGAGWS
jgi:UDP-N-acetyl-D-glucosamine dehydrogenase